MPTLSLMLMLVSFMPAVGALNLQSQAVEQRLYYLFCTWIAADPPAAIKQRVKLLAAEAVDGDSG